jgi:hypothetical protein
MLPLPEPPPPAENAEPEARAPRRGQLVGNWCTVFWLAWVGVAGGFAAVWNSSRTTGLSTWWLGPEADPRFLLVTLLPFAVPLALAVCGFLRLRWLPFYGVGGALVTARVAAGDLGRVNGLALVEFVLAGGGLAVSLACLAGMYRRGPA